MPRKPRSLKQQMDLCTSQLRERGLTWREVAREYEIRYRLPPLRAFREAHRYTQAKVVEIWNTLWPDDALSERRLGAWEAWPGPTGHEPAVANLNRLARIYQCRAGDLINGEDHTDADDCGGRRPDRFPPGSEQRIAGHAGSGCTTADHRLRPPTPGPSVSDAVSAVSTADSASTPSPPPSFSFSFAAADTGPGVRVDRATTLDPVPETARERPADTVGPSHALGVPGETGPPPRLTIGDLRVFLAEPPALVSGDPAPMPARSRDEEFGRLVHALVEWADRMRRRDVLALIASAAAAAHASPTLGHLDADAVERLALAAVQPSRVDATAIEHIEGILHHGSRQEDILGPQAVLETVLAQHGLVRRLLTGASDEDLRRRLLSLLADISRFIGWLLFNQGDHPGAERYYAQARRAAHEADDDLMSSYVLAQWSHLATWCGDPRLGVENALGSLAWAQRAGSPLLTAYANDVGARAYAAVLRRERRGQRARDRARIRTALSAASSSLEAAPADDPGRALVYFYGRGLQLSTRAECFLALRDPDRTIEHTREAMTDIGEGFPRNLAFAHLDLCQAYAQKREVDQACAELDQAARLADRHRSRRLVLALQDRRRGLTPWNGTDPVVRLDERLHAYGLSAGGPFSKPRSSMR